MIELNVEELKAAAVQLHAGDEVRLSGTVYTARDAAHKRIFELIKNNEALPFDLSGAVIYYAGPTPAKPGMAVGSCGPTTSSRMDPYAPRLYDLGISATIGKGPRSKEVLDAIIRNQAVYFCALGGAGALASSKIVSAEVIAFEDLGCESVKKFRFDGFPLFVGADCNGKTIFV